MTSLELLAPARNADTGIAAIDCGADAVYIAGPAFGARKDAGNSVEDVQRLCEYAHGFGARVFVTLNTILMEDELSEAQSLLTALEDAGADAFIVQDLALLKFSSRIPLHASTQCSIKTPERARFLESLGFSRIVMERQTSLGQIQQIRKNIGCEIEYFVHGALCVCYSGLCYLSEEIDRRSANRGSCIQACRSLYDLVDDSGKVLVKNKALLSLKDYNLLSRLEDLALAGVTSFKIEGRLKNSSYVKNVVRAYSIALDEIVRKYPDKYRRASFGKIAGGFTPDLNKTFNRGYTELFLSGKRSSWSSMDTPKSMGEYIGKVKDIRFAGQQMTILISPASSSIALKNGDGFAFVGFSNTIIGFRGDVCSGDSIQCKRISGLKKGDKLFRNISADFEKRLDSDCPTRLLDANARISVTGKEKDYRICLSCRTEDGRLAQIEIPLESDKATNAERMQSLFFSQISKKTGIYDFRLEQLNLDSEDGSMPLVSSSAINGLRRALSDKLDNMECGNTPLQKGAVDASVTAPAEITYKQNVSNSLSEEVYRERGSQSVEKAFELTHRDGAELMRMKYCIKHELGLCPKMSSVKTGTLFLQNNGRKFRLGFDCKNCEMTVSKA